jgi:hypothetical protein
MHFTVRGTMKNCCVYLLVWLPLILNAQHFNPYFMRDFTTPKSCEGEEVVLYPSAVIRHTDSIELTIIGSNLGNFNIKYKGQSFNPGEKITINSLDEFNQLEITGILGETSIEPYVVFQYPMNQQMLHDTIQVLRAHFEISNKVESYLISSSCLDSVTLVFPTIATQNDMYFGEIVEDQYVPLLAYSYYAGMGGNTIKLSKLNRKKYKFTIHGCHSSLEQCTFELK